MIENVKSQGQNLIDLLKPLSDLQGFGVIGGSAEGPQEIEGEPALSLTLGVLPDVSHTCTNFVLHHGIVTATCNHSEIRCLYSRSSCPNVLALVSTLTS